MKRLPAMLIAVALCGSLAWPQRSSPFREIAPHILVRYQQTSPRICTWFFRNDDPQRALLSMRFEYTYTSGVAAGRAGFPIPNSEQDFLKGTLMPGEEAGGEQDYTVMATCSTMSMKVLEAKWQ